MTVMECRALESEIAFDREVIYNKEKEILPRYNILLEHSNLAQFFEYSTIKEFTLFRAK